MSWRDLLQPRPVGVADAAAEVPLLRRLRDALRAPPHPNRYVSPRMRTVDAVAFAARGYRVFWTRPEVRPELAGARTGPLDPSILIYVSKEAGWEPQAGVAVELPTLLPGELHVVASWFSGRHVRSRDWGFLWWNIKRDLSVMSENRRAKRRAT